MKCYLKVFPISHPDACSKTALVGLRERAFSHLEGAAIEAGASIGSNAVLVTPVSVGDGAIVAASSAITKDVSPDAPALERSEQTESAGPARRFRERREKPPECEAESNGRANDIEDEV